MAQVIYVDLVGLSEDEASRAVVEAWRDRAKPARRPPFPTPPARPAVERALFPGLGAGDFRVPKLPPHYLPRPEYLEPLKRAILRQVADKLGITGKGTVGVQGMGGIGKTVLAAAVARAEDVRRAFADGVLWIPVGQTPDLVALQAELAAAAGHPKPVFASAHHGRRELEQLFEGRQTLLVADDVWANSSSRSSSAALPWGSLRVAALRVASPRLYALALSGPRAPTRR